MNCLVNERGEMLEILQTDRDPKEGEFKVPLAGCYEKLNDEKYPNVKWNFETEAWVGVGNPIIEPLPQPSEVDLLKQQVADLTKQVSDLVQKGTT